MSRTNLCHLLFTVGQLCHKKTVVAVRTSWGHVYQELYVAQTCTSGIYGVGVLLYRKINRDIKEMTTCTFIVVFTLLLILDDTES